MSGKRARTGPHSVREAGDPEAGYLIECWTDGASSGKVGPGGWSYVLAVDGKFVLEDSGHVLKTTNQRMEMIAAVVALGQAGHDDRVIIYSDSAYLVNGMNDRWIDNWKRNGWKNRNGDPVKNRDVWERLDALVNKLHSVEWVKVKGHVKNVKTQSELRNHRADFLAVEAKKKAKRILSSETTKEGAA